MDIEEKDNAFKISAPLITDEDIRNINNNFDSIINEFTKQIVVQKDLAIAQYIIKKQQAELEKKDRIVKSIIQRLENDIKNITETKSDGYTDDYRRCRLKAYRTKTREIKEYIEKEYFTNKVEREGK